MTNPIKGLPEPESKSALQRLLIVLAITIGMLIYAYAWTSTEVDLTLPQEPLRQENLTRALRELLSPNIFNQERELQIYEAPFLMDCETGDVPEQADPDASEMVVILEPACADSGDTITVKLLNATVSADARIRWQPPADEEGEEANERPREVLELGREDFVIGSNGNFIGTIEVPRIRGGEGGIHLVRVLVAVPTGPIHLSDTANQVIDRMAQTIFMALVATTVAIPIAVMISFFAARNLMRRVTLSTGTMLLTFITLAVGIWIGSRYFVSLGRVGLTIGRGAMVTGFFGVLLAIIVPALVIAAAGFVLTRIAQMNAPKDKRGLREDPMLQVANTLITSVALIFLVGALGGLAILVGNGITSFANGFRPDAVVNTNTWLVNAGADLVWSVGNVLDIVGTLLELFVAPLVGLITGFGLSGIVGTLFAGVVRDVRGGPGHVLGAIMGGISGAIIMGVMSFFGLWAALLGILPLVIGGILGGQVLHQLVTVFLPKSTIIGQPQRLNQLLKQVAFAVGFVGVVLFLFNYLSFGRSMIDGTLPPQTQVALFGMQSGITSYMFRAALVGMVLGAISGGIVGVDATFPLGDLLYTTSRTALNIVRSIEPLIMGLVFVIWVGIGPFAGVLALTLHSIAALGKLYSEQIENIDPGPIEALQSTGANQVQTIIYAVVPQIIPPYIAFTMYRWDINVRMSTIIGFVGGGGIGLLLQQQINLLRYRDAGVAVLAIAVVVSILDYASAYIREKLT